MDDKQYDHYKETCEIQRRSIKERNGFFLAVCFLTGMVYAVAVSPTSFMCMLNNYLLSQYKFDLTFSINGVQSLLWVLLLYSLMRYIQSSCYIERQYIYINECEKRIKQVEGSISREGESYNSYYPKVLTIIDRLYKYFFPILLLIVVWYKAGTEIIDYFGHHIAVGVLNSIIHLICLILISLLCIAYLVFIRGIVKSDKENDTQVAPGSKHTNRVAGKQ